jgi:hypothetical protein
MSKKKVYIDIASTPVRDGKGDRIEADTAGNTHKRIKKTEAKAKDET